MAEKDRKKKQIRLLQDNLLSIRKIAGLTAEKLGEKIGVTKQTILNLENGKTELTFPHYLAIRTMLDYEIEQNPENTALAQVVEVMDILVANDVDPKNENYVEVRDVVDTVAASASTGKEDASLAKILSNLLSSPATKSALIALGVILIQAGGMTLISKSTFSGAASWLKKIMK